MKPQHLTAIALLAAAVRATRCEDGYELQGGSCVPKHCKPEQCYDKIPMNAHATCLDNCCSWGESSLGPPFFAVGGLS